VAATAQNVNKRFINFIVVLVVNVLACWATQPRSHFIGSTSPCKEHASRTNAELLANSQSHLRKLCADRELLRTICAAARGNLGTQGCRRLPF
jgi:hypothetical protein